MDKNNKPQDKDKILAYYKDRRRKILNALGDNDVIGIIEEKFEVNLPCFQRNSNGDYDSIDAMRRDAYREVVLWLKHEIRLAKLEQNDVI